MLDQKRLSWARGLDLIYRVDGGEVVADRDEVAALQAKLADVEAGILMARKWTAQSTNDVTKNMALALEQVHLLTKAAIRQQIAFAEMGMAVPPPESIRAATPATTAATEDRTGMVADALHPSASLR